MSSRNLDVFEEATDHLFVPIKDVKIDYLDEIECRILRFGKKNTIEWKPRLDPKTGQMEEQKPTDHLRIYLYVYEFRKAEDNFKASSEYSEKFITINPQIKWLSDLKALQVALKDATRDAERICKHRIVIKRKKGTFTAKDGNQVEYAFLKFDDVGPDVNFKEDENDRVADADSNPHRDPDESLDEVQVKAPRVVSNPQSPAQKNQTQAVQNTSAQNTQSQAPAPAQIPQVTQDPEQTTQNKNSEIFAKIAKTFAETTTIEEMTDVAKALVAKTSNKEVQGIIIDLFNKAKANKLAQIVLDSKDPAKFVSIAEGLADKYIKKDNIQQRADLIMFATTQAEAMQNQNSPGYNFTDDIPF